MPIANRQLWTSPAPNDCRTAELQNCITAELHAVLSFILKRLHRINAGHFEGLVYYHGNCNDQSNAG